MTNSVSVLPELLIRAAAEYPDNVAVEDLAGDCVTYSELATLAAAVRERLIAIGVAPGDRVGVYMSKSIDAVATIFGIMAAGAAYVPVDADGPAWRAAFILHDCSVRAVILEEGLTSALREEIARLKWTTEFLALPRGSGGRGLAAVLGEWTTAPDVDRGSRVGADDLAYILYTSGSTGKPKGVMLTHGNALSFIEWCSEVFHLEPNDRFSSHAPLHFDLSILDLYLPICHGATVVLIGSAAGKEPIGLARLIAERRLSIWYSTPSILAMLAQYGKMQRHQYDALRLVLFAGEVFPVKHLRALRALLPLPEFYNLYGPTETNVCTWYRIPQVIEDHRTEPYPIGRVCAHLEGRIVDAQGAEIQNCPGELCISGPSVMRGYWNRPEQTESAFLVDLDGNRWYRTGDLVEPDAEGDLLFLGRRDRMVKRRGYRIELGEIEAGLYRHPAVREAAVVADANANGTVITAFLNCRPEQPPSVVELKQFCANTLPASMVPDRFVLRDAIPKTSTDKVDYQMLSELL